MSLLGVETGGAAGDSVGFSRPSCEISSSRDGADIQLEDG